MERLKDFLSEKTNSDIYNIYYKYIGLLKKDIKISYIDTIKELNHDNEKLTIIVTRELKFTPKNFFSLAVSYYVEHFLKDEYIGIFDWEKFDLSKEINDDIKYYSLNKMSRISLLISQITSSFGYNPIVTPPMFILPKK